MLYETIRLINTNVLIDLRDDLVTELTVDDKNTNTEIQVFKTVGRQIFVTDLINLIDTVLDERRRSK